jgi:hypothetical protein
MDVQWIADLDIMKALKDPTLQFQTLCEPPAAGNTAEATFNDEQLGSTSERPLQDFDPGQYMEVSEHGSPSAEQPQAEATCTSVQNPLCMAHDDSTYEGAKLELLAVENWIELLHTQTKSCIFLAKDNWQARQAATAISMAKGRKTCILSEKTCWACIAEQFPDVAMDGQMATFIA